VSRIGVAECAELLVVAGHEGGAGANSAGGLNDGAIHAETELRHGVGFVDIRASEELRSEIAEDLLGGIENAAVVLAASGDVEHTDENALGAHAKRVIEVSGHSVSNENSGDVSALDLRECGRDRLNDWRVVGMVGSE
jgi:hypothetical protein